MYRKAASGRINALQHILLTLFLNGWTKTPNALDGLRRFREKALEQARGDVEFFAAMKQICDEVEADLVAFERRKN